MSALATQTFETDDPTCDTQFEVLPGLIHRYPTKILLLLTPNCAGRCAYCFRQSSPLLPQLKNRWFDPTAWTKLREYLATQPQVTEIIFSGGDPWTINAQQLEFVFTQLQQLPQLTHWRWHTRVPYFQPQLLIPAWWQVWAKMSDSKEQVVVLHLNHAREITPLLVQIVNKCLDLNNQVWAQGVLLKGTNDQPQILADLWQAELDHQIRPYYLHHLDPAPHTSQFRVSIEQGRQIYQQALTLVSQEIDLKYVVELPQGEGKFPVVQLEKIGPTQYQGRGLRTKKVIYTDPISTDE